jgi:probable HAF family extracellular repeat protein
VPSHRPRRLLAIALLAGFLAPRPASAQTATALVAGGTYAIVDLGTFGGRLSEAIAINDAGAITGWSDVPAGGQRAFVFENGKLTDLGTLGGRTSFGFAINASGAIAGMSQVADGTGHAALWTREGAGWKIADLGGLGGDMARALAINDAGDVVGQAYDASRSSHAFRWSKGSFTDLGAVAKAETAAHAISAGGAVAGFLRVGPGGPGALHACLWTVGRVVDLGEPWAMGPFAGAFAIDDAGETLSHVVVDGKMLRLMRLPGEKTLVLGAWSGPHGVVQGVNRAGVAVGYKQVAGGDMHAFRWDVDPGGGGIVATDLGTLGGSGTASEAFGVNAKGWIVGDSDRSRMGDRHLVLWRPVSPR